MWIRVHDINKFMGSHIKMKRLEYGFMNGHMKIKTIKHGVNFWNFFYIFSNKCTTKSYVYANCNVLLLYFRLLPIYLNCFLLDPMTLVLWTILTFYYQYAIVNFFFFKVIIFANLVWHCCMNLHIWQLFLLYLALDVDIRI